MSNEITMPKLCDTMEEGKILRWLKHPGDQIRHGEAIAEVETDKADMVLEAFDDGVLGEIKLQEGESAPVGAVIATLKGEGSGASAPKAVASPAEASTEKQAEPRPALKAVRKKKEVAVEVSVQSSPLQHANGADDSQSYHQARHRQLSA